MKTLMISVKRNTKLFFKDKGMFFTSLITPLILLILYVTFLRNVYESSFVSAFSACGVTVDDRLLNGLVGGELISSLLAVSCVTVSFCSNMLMVQDKVNGARADMLVSPVKRHTIALAYYISTTVSALIINLLALAASLVYVAIIGWYMSFADVLLMVADVFILVTFGTALSSIINYFLSSQGQISAVGTVVSSCYGFVCGAYMPLASFSDGLRNVIMFLPGTYGTSLIRNHAMNGALSQLEQTSLPAQVIEGVRDSIDCNLYFFGSKVEIWVMYLITLSTIFVLLAAYVLINALRKDKNK